MFNTYYIKHNKYIEQIKEDIDAAEAVLSTSGDLNLKSFDLHDKLNDKIWDEQSNLKPGIREKLMQIARDFYDTLDIAEITEDGDPDAKLDPTFDKYIKDVLFVGSLASFNYSSYADVDLHLLMDENKVVGNNKLALNILKKYFTECKNDWNLKHTGLNVEGYDCELYVQDVNETNAANGVYSLFNDEWVKRPEPMTDKNLDRAWVEKKALDYIDQIDNLEEVINSQSDMDLVEKAKDELKRIKDKIVQGRRNSLASGAGEMNSYNILFKILRRSGHIGKINDLTVKAYDMINSFNNLKKGNDMRKTDESIVTEADIDAIAEFEDMYGSRASEALKKYLAKRSSKTAEEVLTSDDEFDKFANWAYKHLNIDVYSNFTKYDKGTFYKRTSDLIKDPEQRGDRRGRSDIDDTFYSVVDGEDDDFDSATDTWKEPSKFDDSDDDSIQEESIHVKYHVINEDEQKIFGKTWDEFVKNIETSTPYKVDSKFKTQPNQNITVIDKDLKQHPANVTKYSDGSFEMSFSDSNSTGESIEVVEDDGKKEDEEQFGKAKIILGKVDDEQTIIITSNEPGDEANKVLKELGGDKWTKDKEYNYWYFTSPMKIADVQTKLKSFENTFSIEVQEANEKEVEQQPTTTDTPAEEQPNESEVTSKIVGVTWDEFLKNIEEQTNYSIDSAFRRHPNQWIELVGKDGQIYDGEVTKYDDGEYELLYTNIHPVPNVESKKPAPLNESYADDAIENIKGVIRKYFEIDPETEEESPDFDENFTAQDAIDEIVDILY